MAEWCISDICALMACTTINYQVLIMVGIWKFENGRATFGI